jgi:EAL domain-containing protein (putative c-di-GMP-specific phosphodiesterase class I)
MVDHLDIKAFIVHIMSVQVLKHDFVEKVENCIQKYDVNPSLVIFCISDTIGIQAKGVIDTILEKLKEKGMYFFLAIHDAGFNSLSPEIMNKFIGVVINVKRQYEESDRDQAEIFIKNRISMAQELGKMVVLIGVDNKQLYDVVSDMPVEIIVGNYLSPMVSKEGLKQKFINREMFFA